MAERKPKTNNFGGTPRPTTVSDVRKAAETWLLNNPGVYTVDQIAAFIGYDREYVRKQMTNMVVDGSVINTTPDKRLPLYQYAGSPQRLKSTTVRTLLVDEVDEFAASLTTGDDPITNAGMPNGSQAYWAAHMARFKANPREV